MKKFLLLGSALLIFSGCEINVSTNGVVPSSEKAVVENKVDDKKTETNTATIDRTVEAVDEKPKASTSDEFTYPGYPLRLDTKKYDANVKKVQIRLNKIGYNLDVDGYFGPKTSDAVKYIQEQNDLEMDGIVGPKTWDVLFFNTMATDEQVFNPYGE